MACNESYLHNLVLGANLFSLRLSSCLKNITFEGQLGLIYYAVRE
jgi:hypothetical protein